MVLCTSIERGCGVELVLAVVGEALWMEVWMELW